MADAGAGGEVLSLSFVLGSSVDFPLGQVSRNILVWLIQTATQTGGQFSPVNLLPTEKGQNGQTDSFVRLGRIL